MRRPTPTRWRSSKGQATTEHDTFVGLFIAVGLAVAATLFALLTNQAQRERAVQAWQAIQPWLIWAVLAGLAVATVVMVRQVLRTLRPAIWIDDDVLHIRRGNIRIPLDQIQGVVYAIDPPGSDADEYVYFVNVDPQFRLHHSTSSLGRRVSLSSQLLITGDSPEWLGSVGLNTLKRYGEERIELAHYIQVHNIPCDVDLTDLTPLSSTLPAWTDNLPVARIGG